MPACHPNTIINNVTNQLCDDGGPQCCEMLRRNSQKQNTEAKKDLSLQRKRSWETQTVRQFLCISQSITIVTSVKISQYISQQHQENTPLQKPASFSSVVIYMYYFLSFIGVPSTSTSVPQILSQQQEQKQWEQ